METAASSSSDAGAGGLRCSTRPATPMACVSVRVSAVSAGT
ncbi:hypothetical protein [Microbacterium sp. NIBRBAC000506063]|nr:hypothetical protein [Microbacterium sp. NIBRBAC000506063]